jgi:hypothetical protein
MKADYPESPDVDHPTHYTSHPSGIECIDVIETMPFNVGNAIKYLWRAGLKGDARTDYRKAIWYIKREIARLSRGSTSKCSHPSKSRVNDPRVPRGWVCDSCGVFHPDVP